MVREHASEQGWSFVGPVDVHLAKVDGLDTGMFSVRSAVVTADAPPPGPLPDTRERAHPCLVLGPGELAAQGGVVLRQPRVVALAELDDVLVGDEDAALADDRLLVAGLALQACGHLDGLHDTAEDARERTLDHASEPTLEALQHSHARSPSPRSVIVSAQAPGTGPAKVGPALGRVAEWQTRTVQVRVSERTWGFNSPLAHHDRPPCTTQDEARAAPAWASVVPGVSPGPAGRGSVVRRAGRGGRAAAPVEGARR